MVRCVSDGTISFGNAFTQDGAVFTSSISTTTELGVSTVLVNYSINGDQFTVGNWIDNKTYDAANETLTFSYYSGNKDLYEGMDYDTLNKASNVVIRISFEDWNAMLSDMGTNINDVAFPSYSGL